MPRKIYGDVAIYGCESSHECAHGFVVVANYTLLDRPPRYGYRFSFAEFRGYPWKTGLEDRLSGSIPFTVRGDLGTVAFNVSII